MVFPVVITFGVAGILAGRHAQAAVLEFFPWSSPSAYVPAPRAGTLLVVVIVMSGWSCHRVRGSSAVDPEWRTVSQSVHVSRRNKLWLHGRSKWQTELNEWIVHHGLQSSRHQLRSDISGNMSDSDDEFMITLCTLTTNTPRSLQCCNSQAGSGSHIIKKAPPHYYYYYYYYYY